MSSAEGASVEATQAPMEWGSGRSVPLPNRAGVWGRGFLDAVKTVADFDNFR